MPDTINPLEWAIETLTRPYRMPEIMQEACAAMRRKHGEMYCDCGDEGCPDCIDGGPELENDCQ
jgi:hypothetical protein